MRKAAIFGHTFGVINIFTGTTGPFFRNRIAVIIKLQRNPDHVISLFMQQDCCGGTVNSATHCQHDSFCHRSTTLIQRYRCVLLDHGRCARPAPTAVTLVGREGAFDLVLDGRADDLLKLGGIFVSPLEVEGVLLQHEAVVEAVLALPPRDRYTRPPKLFLARLAPTLAEVGLFFRA